MTESAAQPESAAHAESQPAVAPEPAATPAPSTDFADGAWHRLHPATPLFRGGLALIAVVGVLIVNLRDRIVGMFVGDDVALPPTTGDLEAGAIDFIIRENLVIPALAAGAGILLLVLLGFSLSWRVHMFRITDEVVEVRSGILFRTNRKARLDRIQGINIARPSVPRLFGAAKLEITVAGNDASVPLAYLRGSDADALRRVILVLASGAQRPAADDARETGATPAGAGLGGIVEERVSQLLAPELDVDVATPESVVRMNLGRLIGSTLLSTTMLILLAILAATVVLSVTTGEVAVLVLAVSTLIAGGGFFVSRITRSLRYSIAATPDGVRVGFGLLSTTNETLPPGRIHSVKVSQPLPWRPAGWWQISVNRASRSSQNGAAGQQQTTILPVGNLDDVRAVLRLLVPEVATDDAMPLLELGIHGRDGEGGYTVSPPRARVLRWFARRRNGYLLSSTAVLLRTGAIWRALTIVPLTRTQSVSVVQGPLLRALRLGAVNVHTVAGPIVPAVGALDRVDAMRLFDAVAAASVTAANADTSHRWRQA